MLSVPLPALELLLEALIVRISCMDAGQRVMHEAAFLIITALCKLSSAHFQAIDLLAKRHVALACLVCSLPFVLAKNLQLAGNGIKPRLDALLEI